MKRRDFLKAGLSAPFALEMLLASGCSTAFRSLTSRRGLASEEAEALSAAGRVRVRCEVSSPEARRHLASYEKAIGIMKDRTALAKAVPGFGQGLLWEAQAQVHKASCPHGTWKFFPWHREYLFRFEAIIRKLSGDAEFALPYWDWTSNPRLPASFCAQDSFLAAPDHSRDAASGAKITAQLKKIAGPSIFKSVMATKDFESFMGSTNSSGEAEYGPHNGVHVVLGSFGSPMGAFLSPLDPIFWMHHCNVDRLWAMWQASNPVGRSAAQIAGKFPEWLTEKLEGSFDKSKAGFYDTDGKPISTVKTARDVLNTTALGYAYPETTSRRTTAGLKGGTDRRPAFESVEESRDLSDAAIAATPPSLLTRAFTRDYFPAKADFADGTNTSAVVTFPDFKDKEGVGYYIDHYVENPDGVTRNPRDARDTVQLRNLIFRLKVKALPRIQNVIMEITHLPPDQAPIHVANYSFFGGHEDHKGHEGDSGGDFVPIFNLDYSKLLDLLHSRGMKYPDLTQFRFRFLSGRDGQPVAVRPGEFSQLAFQLVILEKT